MCQPKRLTLQEKERSEREPKRLDFEREREREMWGWVGKWGLNGGGNRSLGRFEREKEYRVCNGH